MALINCPECLKEVSDNAKMCPHCGFPLKKKGKGFAIASLVLGIFACVYSMPVLSLKLVDPPKEFAIGMALYVMIFAILSLIFGLVSHKKGCKLKIKTAGITLSIISIVLLLAGIIMVL